MRLNGLKERPQGTNESGQHERGHHVRPPLPHFRKCPIRAEVANDTVNGAFPSLARRRAAVRDKLGYSILGANGATCGIRSMGGAIPEWGA